jgi:hypothetical protein
MGSGVMSVDEARMQLRTRLEELVGVSGAEILMDRPPGGWSDLVTNHTLDLRFAAWEERFAASEQRFDHKLDALEARVDRKFDAVLAEMRAGFAAIDLKVDLMRAEFDARMDRRFRSQTLVMFSTFVALSGVIVAALKF